MADDREMLISAMSVSGPPWVKDGAESIHDSGIEHELVYLIYLLQVDVLLSMGSSVVIRSTGRLLPIQ